MGSDKTLIVKTVKSTDPEEFDNEVNTLIEEGYWLKKRLAKATEEEIFFVAFLEMKVYVEDEEMEEEIEEDIDEMED